MTNWQENLQAWGAAWATIRESDLGVAEQILGWPAATGEFSAPVIHLVTADAADATDAAGVAGAREFAATSGWAETGAVVLLTAVTEELDLVPQLPPNTNLAEVPLEHYDAVEVALFDRPVAGGRVKVGDGFAVLGGLHVDGQEPAMEVALEAVMLASLGEEAFLHGADTLYLVADPAQASRVAPLGWTQVAQILSFRR